MVEPVKVTIFVSFSYGRFDASTSSAITDSTTILQRLYLKKAFQTTGLMKIVFRAHSITKSSF